MHVRKVIGVHPDTVDRLLHRHDCDRHSHTHGSLQTAPYCDAPKRITLSAARKRWDFKPLPDNVRVMYDQQYGGGTFAVNMQVPCRKCAKCAYMRSRMYEEKIKNDIMSARSEGINSYFVTLTFTVGKRAALWKQSVAMSGDGHVTKRLRAKPVVAEVATFVRRLRDRNKRLNDVKLRYISVIEYHKSGDPHVHMVISGKLNSKVIRAARWKGGYLHIRRIPKEAGAESDMANYVSKYIAKDCDALVTSSKHYGCSPFRYNSKHAQASCQARYDENELVRPVTHEPSTTRPEDQEEEAGVKERNDPSTNPPPHNSFYKDPGLLRLTKICDLDLERPSTAVELQWELELAVSRQGPVWWRTEQSERESTPPRYGNKKTSVRTPASGGTTAKRTDPAPSREVHSREEPEGLRQAAPEGSDSEPPWTA